MTTKIEWVRNIDGTQGKTWNPVTGCTKISLGCRHCYAERMAKRLAGRHGYPANRPFRVTTHPERLAYPLHWRKPTMIFVCSMSDTFHANIPSSFVMEMVHIMRQCPHHTFQVLTKRVSRMVQLSQKVGKWPENVWLGVTVETREYKNRIDALRKIQAAVKFVSCEPLLGDLGRLNLCGIDWVIVGGESGPYARKMEESWACSVRDQCKKESVPFFFKQWGGVHKKRNGRILQGKLWNEIPFRSRADWSGCPT